MPLSADQNPEWYRPQPRGMILVAVVGVVGALYMLLLGALVASSTSTMSSSGRRLYLALAFVILPLGMLAMSGWAVRSSRYRRGQQRALLADRHAVRAVSALVRFGRRGRYRFGAWILVTDRTTGEEIGWVEPRHVLPGFDPKEICWMSGALDPEGWVLLENEGRTHLLAPVGPLAASVPDPVEWCPIALRLLGWQNPHPLKGAAWPEVLPTSGRVQPPPAEAGPDLWSLARQIRQRRQTMWPPWARLATFFMVGLFGLVVGWWGIPLAVALGIGLRATVGRASRPLVRALEETEPLEGRSARLVAELLIGLVSADSIATPGPAGSPGRSTLPAPPPPSTGGSSF